MATRKTYVTLVVGAVVALVPPFLVYLQATAEMRSRARGTEAEADAGYKTLVESVRELQVTVSAQHDALVKMQGYLDAFRDLSPSLRMTARPTAPPAPDFHDLPASLDAVQMKR